MINFEFTPEEALDELKKSLSSAEFVLHQLKGKRTNESPVSILYSLIQSRLSLVERFSQEGQYEYGKDLLAESEKLIAEAKEAIGNLEEFQKSFERV
ncbi:MAG: hypothetical protein PHX52_02395 [Candidatus Pacebacteria bacterium]|nr:hypothetical protein [Candidatus Paceibacterota bacterium]MDD3919411.1 hypothetical protein [Candidatus Paceibacterota bacterium]